MTRKLSRWDVTLILLPIDPERETLTDPAEKTGKMAEMIEGRTRKNTLKTDLINSENIR